MITVENLTKRYNAFKAIDNLTMSFDDEMTIIVGASGSGKSTLLHAIGTLDNNYDGKILINSNNVKDLPDKKQAEFRNNTLGFVFQNFYLEPKYTVYENVLIPLLIKKISKEKRKEMVLSTLKAVGLEKKVNNKAKNLSGGEAQRVAIARAIVTNPKIILADEPCGNLDSQNGKIIMDILKKFSEEGKCVIVVTHNTEHIKYGKKVIYLKDGKIDDSKK